MTVARRSCLETRTTAAAPCLGLCKAWTCPGTFQKVCDCGHNHGGVIVYHYYVGIDPECERKCMENRRDSRVLIVQNTSNVDIATEVFTNDIVNSKCKCSFCSEILRHTWEMLRDITIIKKHEIRGICNNCKMCHTTCKQCAQCNEVIKSFVNCQVPLCQRRQYCRLQTWFQKIRDTLNAHQGRIVPERQRDLLEMAKSRTGFREPDVGELFSEDDGRIRSLKSGDYNQHPSQRHETSKVSIIPADDNFLNETHKGKGQSKDDHSRARSLDDYEKMQTLKKGAAKHVVSSKGTKKSAPKSPLHLKSQKQKKGTISKSEDDMHDIQKNKSKTKNKDSGKEKSESKSKDKDSDIAQGKLGRAKEKGSDGKSKDKDSDIAQRKLDRGKEKRGDGKAKDKDFDIAQKKLGRAKEKGGDGKSKDKDSDIAQRKLDRGKEKGGDGKAKDKDFDIAQKKPDREKEKGTDDSQKQSKRKDQADAGGGVANSSMFLKMMKDKKELGTKVPDKSIKKNVEDIQMKPKKEVKDFSVNIAVKQKPVKATPSQILRFREKADQQRNSITGVDGNNNAKSVMSSFNDEIFRKLSLDRLPTTGQIYKYEGNISTLGSMTSVNTGDGNRLIIPSPNKIKLPSHGIKENEQPRLEYGRIREQRKQQKKDEHEMKFVIFESGDDLYDGDYYNIDTAETQQYKIEKMIVGSKVCKYKPKKSEKVLEPKPLFFKVLDIEQSKEFSRKTELEDINVNEQQLKASKSTKKLQPVKSEPPKGIVRYALSDRQFIDKGWTMLPTEKIVRKMNVYRMRPVRPEFGWFSRNKRRCPMSYDSGEELAVIDDAGNGRWFYRNGQIALDYHGVEETNTQQRYVVYSLGKSDARYPQRSTATTVLACFDWLGNGVVYDHSGQVRLKYNQTEGVLLDKSLGPASHWKWHTLNDPPELQQIMIDTQLPHKEPEILKHGQGDHSSRPKMTSDNEEMLAIEHENFVKEKSKKLAKKFKPYQIKMKALKINDQFSLRVMDQATVYLLFRDGQNSLKLNLGMSLDPREIVDTETTDVGEVSSSYDRLPAQSASLADIQEMIMNAKKREKCRTDQMQRIKRPERQLSVEQLKSALCKPRKLISSPELHCYL